MRMTHESIVGPSLIVRDDQNDVGSGCDGFLGPSRLLCRADEQTYEQSEEKPKGAIQISQGLLVLH